MNEQTYINTICRGAKHGCGCKPKPKCDKDCCFTEYTCCTPRGKLTLRSDRHSTGICVEVNHCDCDENRHRDKKDCH